MTTHTAGPSESDRHLALPKMSQPHHGLRSPFYDRFLRVVNPCVSFNLPSRRDCIKSTTLQRLQLNLAYAPYSITQWTTYDVVENAGHVWCACQDYRAQRMLQGTSPWIIQRSTSYPLWPNESTVIDKKPEFNGQLCYHVSRARNRTASLLTGIQQTVGCPCSCQFPYSALVYLTNPLYKPV